MKICIHSAGAQKIPSQPLSRVAPLRRLNIYDFSKAFENLSTPVKTTRSLTTRQHPIRVWLIKQSLPTLRDILRITQAIRQLAHEGGLCINSPTRIGCGRYIGIYENLERRLGSSKAKSLLDLCVPPSCKITLTYKKGQPPLLLTVQRGQVLKFQCYNFTRFSSTYVRKKREKTLKSAQVAEITIFLTSILTQTNVIFHTHPLAIPA